MLKSGIAEARAGFAEVLLGLCALLAAGLGLAAVGALRTGDAIALGGAGEIFGIRLFIFFVRRAVARFASGG